MMTTSRPRVHSSSRTTGQPPPSTTEALRLSEEKLAKAFRLSSEMIPAVLDISSWTVCTYLRRLFAKLGVASRAAMVAKLHEHGFLGSPQGLSRNGRQYLSRDGRQ